MNPYLLTVLTTTLILQLNYVTPCLFSNKKDTRKGHLLPLGEQGKKMKTDQVQGFLDPASFVQKYMLPERPVIMRQAVAHYKAIELWTDKYLEEKFPDGPPGEVYVERGQLDDQYGQSYSYMPFKDYLQIYNKTEIYMMNSMPDSLQQDFILPYPLQCQHFIQEGLRVQNMWYSSGGMSGILHQDGLHNIYCILRGRKYIVIMNQTKYEDIEDLILDRKPLSTMDVDKVDLDKWPMLAGLEFHHMLLKPGDCVFIPYRWYHQVRSFDSNLAVNIWWQKSDKLRDEKLLESCETSVNENISFSDVYFQKELLSTRSDVRQLLETFISSNCSNLQCLLQSLCLSKTDVCSSSQFLTAVERVFEVLDQNSDGFITSADLYEILNHTAAQSANLQLDAYNSLVFKLRLEFQTNDNQPVYLYRHKSVTESLRGAFGDPRTSQQQVKYDKTEL